MAKQIKRTENAYIKTEKLQMFLTSVQYFQSYSIYICTQ